MSTWNPDSYLKFGDERTRPSVDLISRIQLPHPTNVVDLGCGPGNSTQVLRARWPSANIVGIDSSPEMISAAKRSYPEQSWLIADASTWEPTVPVDLIFSNATLHWLSSHETLIPRLFSVVAPGGAFAFQIPSSTFPTVRTLIHDISRNSRWDDRMHEARNSLTMHEPGFYYDILAPHANQLDIWETEYIHTLESSDAIVDWMASTGLRPFLSALQQAEERSEFLKELRTRVASNYQTRVDGKVLFPFRRLFVVASPAFREPAQRS